jgi:hypothetical protein
MSDKIGYTLWLNMIKKIPTWELFVGIFFVGFALLVTGLYWIIRIYQVPLFHAFEKIKLKKKDIDQALANTRCIEVTIPKNSQATAFQVQQKILKAFHSIYTDPIEGPHNFSRTFYFFQKLYRLWKVSHTRQIFFTMQMWAQYPHISFRLFIPTTHFDRIEKAIFNAYPHAEITMIDKTSVVEEISKFQKSYLSYGQSTIEGKFYHRVKTFKDVSSDPIDSIISTMEGLEKGRFMVYNIFVSPTSHFFNQIIHFLLEEQGRLQGLPEEQKNFPAHKQAYISEYAILPSTCSARYSE